MLLTQDDNAWTERNKQLVEMYKPQRGNEKVLSARRMGGGSIGNVPVMSIWTRIWILGTHVKSLEQADTDPMTEMGKRVDP